MAHDTHPRSKRTRILDIAEREFLEHGFDGTSIDSIVEHAGGSKSTVYAHFRDKSILFAEALAGIRQEIDFSLTRFRDTSPAHSAEALVLMAVELISVQYHERALHLLRVIIAESDRFPEVAHQYYHHGPAELTRQVAAFLDESRRFGARFNGTTEHAAELLLSLSQGPRQMRILMGLEPPPDPQTTAEFAEEIVERFVSLVAWIDAPPS
jgi:AcrR family transcriptional regulator